MVKQSKIELIKQHLIKHKSITGVQALTFYGYYRLSSGINKLRKRGMDIETIKTHGIDRKGNEVSFATYKLGE